MILSVRELQHSDIEKIVDYFVHSNARFLKRMGADKNKLPSREEWIKKIELELQKTNRDKTFYYIIWLIDDQAIGHSNIDKIEFGKTATMHFALMEK